MKSEESNLVTRLRMRYHAMMKRSIRKLVIRLETLRGLAERELGCVAGGKPDAQLVDTGNAGSGCVAVQVAMPAKP